MGVDRISNGQINNTGLDLTDSAGTIIFDAANGVLDLVMNSKQRQTMETNLANWNNQIALATITTAQQLLAYPFAGGLLNSPNRRVKLEYEGIFTSPGSATPTLTIALLMGGKATLQIKVVTIPAVGSTLNVNGTTVTFIANGATPVGNQIALGATAAATATAIYTFLNASTDTNIALCVWTNPTSAIVLGTATANGYLPTLGSSVLNDFTLQYGVSGAQTLATTTTDQINTTGAAGLQLQGEIDIIIPQANNSGGVSPIVCKTSIGAQIQATSAGAISFYTDTNVEQDTITIGTNPAVGDTITVNGTLVTFIVNGGTPVGNQVALGTTATNTATAIKNFLAASTDANISKTTWTNSSTTVIGNSKVAGWVTFVTTSVPAKITYTTPTLDLTLPQVISLTIASSGGGITAATLQNATLKLIQ
jgi:hypothetical protein